LCRSLDSVPSELTFFEKEKIYQYIYIFFIDKKNKMATKPSENELSEITLTDPKPATIGNEQDLKGKGGKEERPVEATVENIKDDIQVEKNNADALDGIEMGIPIDGDTKRLSGTIETTGVPQSNKTPPELIKRRIPIISDTELRNIYKAKIVAMISVIVCVILGSMSVMVGMRNFALVLIGLGIEVLLDAQSSIVVLWRFSSSKKDFERKSLVTDDAIKAKQDRDLKREQKGSQIVAVIFVIVGIVLTLSALWKLMTYEDDNHLENNEAVIFETYYGWPTAFIFLILAMAKYRLGKKLNSDVLRLDAISSLLGSILALIVGITGVLEEYDGAWVADPVAAIIISIILVGVGLHTWIESKTTSKHAIME